MRNDKKEKISRRSVMLSLIQEADEWEKCVNFRRADFDCDIYITGSNAGLLSGEPATYPGGI